VSPVRYNLGFYISEDGILHSHRREKLKQTQTTSNRYYQHCVLQVNVANISVLTPLMH
jgi:hypothetical protein